jgi:hypothetical protein
VKLRYRRLHVGPSIAPIAARRPVQEFLIFADINAPVQAGDLVTLPDESLCKIIDVRGYPCSLQCILQRSAFSLTPVWSPSSALTQVLPTKALSDPVYQSAGNVLAVLEPHGIEQGGALEFGQADRRRCWVFSAQALAIQTVLLFGGDYWIVTETSGVWAVTNDFRAPCRRLALPPFGVK